MKKIIIFAFLLLFTFTGCIAREKEETYRSENEEVSSDRMVEMCMQMLDDQAFLDFVNVLEKESDENKTIRYLIDYSHFEYPDVPEGCGLFIVKTMNPDIENYTILPKQTILDSFNTFTSLNGTITEFYAITVSKETEKEWVSFYISPYEYSIIDAHLVKGDSHDALYQTGIFFGNPGINVHWRMNYIQLNEEWYLVWFECVK